MAKKKTSKAKETESKSVKKTETKASVLNSHLADRIAGKVDERGNAL